FLETLRSNLASDLASEFEERYRTEYQRSAHLVQAREAFSSNSRRLLHEIGALSRRGNLNLVIWVLTTFSVASLLFYTTIQAAHGFTTITDLLTYYIPRIMTVIFIE